jgi:hypothetical protein
MCELIGHYVMRAAKPHVCDFCRRKITVGDRYVRDVGKDCGSVYNLDYHQDCFEACCRLHDDLDVPNKYLVFSELDREERQWLRNHGFAAVVDRAEGESIYKKE